MLTASLTVQDLADRPQVLRVTDATAGYAIAGNAARSDITRAVVSINRSGVNGLTLIATSEIPLSAILIPQAVDLPYPAGGSVDGDGLLVLIYSLYSATGAPVLLATYQTIGDSVPFNPLTQSIFIKTNGAWQPLAGQPASTQWSYRIEASADVLTDWRIVTTATGVQVAVGTFSVSDRFLSPDGVGQVTTEPGLIARVSVPVLLLSRTRRSLNQLSERLIFDERTPLPESLSNMLLWVRLYEKLAELVLNPILDATPVRLQLLLADVHVNLKSLWLRAH